MLMHIAWLYLCTCIKSSPTLPDVNTFETENDFLPGYTSFELFHLAFNHFHIIMKAEM